MRRFKKRMTLLVATSMSFGALVCLSNQKILETVNAAVQNAETPNTGESSETPKKENITGGTILFNEMEGFETWEGGYSTLHKSSFNGFGVGDINVQLRAMHQTSTIKDVPVTKDGENKITLTDAYFKSLDFTFKKWSSKENYDIAFTSGTNNLGKMTEYHDTFSVKFPADKQLSEITFKNNKSGRLGLVSVTYSIYNYKDDGGVTGHTVNFKDGEDILSSETIADGKLITKPKDPIKKGYTFEGWYNEKELLTPFDFNKSVTGDVDIFAKFVPLKEEITNLVDVNKDGTYLVKGEVVGRRDTNSVMIQDSTGAILVKGDGIETLTLGQEVSLKGSYSKLKNNPELNVVSDLQVLDTNDITITPIADLTEVTRDNVSKYVELDNLVVDSVTSDTWSKIKLNTKDFMITINKSQLENVKGLTSLSDIKKGMKINVKGAINIYNNDLQIMPSELSYDVKYNVTFNSLGGSDVPALEVVKGEVVTLPANPTKDGYEFLGWFTDEACTKAFDKETIITSDITLYAGWKDTTPSLTLGTVEPNLYVGEKTSLAATVENIDTKEVVWEVIEGQELVNLSTPNLTDNVSTQEITAIKEGTVKLQAKVTVDGSADPIKTDVAVITIKHEIRDVDIKPMANLGLSFVKDGADGIISTSMLVSTGMTTSLGWDDKTPNEFKGYVDSKQGVVDLTDEFLLEEQKNRLSVEYRQGTAQYAYLKSSEIRLYKGCELEFKGLNGLKISSVNVKFGDKKNGLADITGTTTVVDEINNSTLIKFDAPVSSFVLTSNDKTSIASVEINYEKPGKVNKYTDVRLGYKFELPTTFTDKYEVTNAGVKVMNGKTLVEDIPATSKGNTYTAVLDHITDENLTTRYEAIPYVVIDGETYFLDSINYSVEDLVDYYLSMEGLDSTLNPIVKDLKNHINQTR